jgi:hypothetical protein
MNGLGKMKFGSCYFVGLDDKPFEIVSVEADLSNLLAQSN